jgi:hypothetical protein
MRVLYGSQIQWLFVIRITLMDGYYRMNIIRNVGQSRLNLVVPLVLCTVAYNIQGTSVVLQIP